MDMINNFERVCSAYEVGQDMHDKALTCLNILKVNSGEMTPKEIAVDYAKSHNPWDNYHTISKELIMLAKLGLIQRREEPSTITIEQTKWTRIYDDEEPNIIYVNGVEYTRTSERLYHMGWKDVETTIRTKKVYYKYIG